MGEKGRRRQTQEERRTKTRQKLLDAVIESLVELGYARTSTLEVQKRSGLSRGALLHHFPSKTALLLAAVHHLAGLRFEQVKQQLRELPEGEERLDKAIQVIWNCFSDKLFYVSMELRTAARTDEELREVLIQVELEWRRTLFALSPRLFGKELTEQNGFPAALDLMIQSMIGTAMTAILHQGEERIYRLVDCWKTLLIKLVKEPIHTTALGEE